MNRATLSLLSAFAAGFGSLIVELQALRTSSALLPGTLPAAALVVSAFLFAWALGSLVSGRVADRTPSPLRVAALWLGLGALFAFAAPGWFGSLAREAPPTGMFDRLWAGSAPVLLVAFLVGGGLPFISRVRREDGLSPSRATGFTAATMALGGACACSAWPFILGGGLGGGAMAGSLALGLSAGGIGFLSLSPPLPASEEAPLEEIEGPKRRAFVYLVAALVAGFVLVAGQLALLRLAAQVHGNSVATTTEILGGLHVGMAVGAGLLAILPLQATPRLAVAFLLALGGLALGLPILALPSMDMSPDPFWSLLLSGLLGCGAGSVVTAAARAKVRRKAAFGSWVGDLAALSTLGGLLGGLAYTQFLSVHFSIGTDKAFLLLSLAGLACAVLVAASHAVRSPGQLTEVAPPGRMSASLFGLAVFALGWQMAFLPGFDLPWKASPEEVTLIEQREGPWGVVSLVRTTTGDERLKLDNRFGLGGSALSYIEQRMGRVAAAMHPTAERALLLGVGRGQTLAGLASTTEARVDAIERNGDILAMNLPLPFLPEASPPGGMPAVHHADAREWVATHPSEYDLIVGDLFIPWFSGAGALFAVENLRHVRRALREKGVFVQWLPLHQMPWDAFGSVVRSFIEVFPDGRLFINQPLSPQPLVALVGGMVEGIPDGETINALLSRQYLPMGPNAAVEVYDLHVSERWALSERFSDAPLATLDRPHPELLSLHGHRDEPRIAATNLRLLSDLVQPLTPADLTRRPVSNQEERQMGVEFAARAAALQVLLDVQASLADFAHAEADALLPVQKEGLHRRVDGALLHGWKAFPRHLSLRTALLDRASQHLQERRDEEAGALLQEAHFIYPDPVISGSYGGLLLHFAADTEALHVLEAAHEADPINQTVLLHYGSALTRNGHDAEARKILIEARDIAGGGFLPPDESLILGMLERRADALALGQRRLEEIGQDHPWRLTLERLLAKGTGPQ